MMSLLFDSNLGMIWELSRVPTEVMCANSFSITDKANVYFCW